ncbi:methionyl-tRNA formyltransferase [bacterium]|nr:methionyl-tRNA formyltransferase [bacterium]
MKIILVGYGEMLKALVLGILNTEHEIVGVFRHDNVLYSPFKKKINDIFRSSDDFNFIKTLKLPEINAKSANSDAFIREVKRLKADIIIVGSWSEKFSAQTINSPKIACINVHPSLLPKYRGPNPYLQVILKNESKTGITFHLMDVNYDTGSILHQAELPILPNDTGKSLRIRCCNLAKAEVKTLLDNFDNKLKNQQSQKETEATYLHNISLREAILDFKNETSEQIDRRIRALTPWLNCFIPYKNDFFEFKNYKILKEISVKQPATVVKKGKQSIGIVCRDGKVIQFMSLKTKRPFADLLQRFYFDTIIKENEQAV